MSIRRFLPLLVFIGLFIALMVGLSLNPREIPSARINKSVPEFSLPSLKGDGVGLSSEIIKNSKKIVLVNFFASWCGACRIEHPFLMKLSKMSKANGIVLYGISYKDKPANSLTFLNKFGNPYVRVGVDLKGRTAINFGVTGTPETYIIKNGIIRYQHIGPIYGTQIKDMILPMIKKLQQEGKP
ncbi:MAG: DsbE family thiol:disulfide interchange protein [Alphaproteobacteria bacterium]|nr:DsbE family thiol:disulfide interchange protein [Alphaproteobacteria bacterium]